MPSIYRQVPYKRNVRKIPALPRLLLQAEPESRFIAGVVKRFTLSELSAGALSHLGVQVNEGVVTYPSSILPPNDMGRFSKRNASGWMVIRRDLPKETFEHTFVSPIWGDWSRGSNTITQYRERFRREQIPAPLHPLLLENLIEGKSGDPVFKISVEMPLNRQQPDFEEKVLWGLNLLQENLGTTGLLHADATGEELIGSLNLSWDIFPPGTVDEVVERMVGRMPTMTKDQQTVMRERVQMFSRLKPRDYIQGQGVLGQYFGARFADDLVVFENLHYGNALYVLYGDWQELSQMSRLDIQRLPDDRYMRFKHTPGWKERFIQHMLVQKIRRGIAELIVGDETDIA